MSKIKMTQTIARILAERAKRQIEASLETKAEAVKKDVLTSKEYKLLEKNVAQIQKLKQEQDQLMKAIQDKFHTTSIRVSADVYRDEISVRAGYRVNASEIMDNIIVKAHFADSGTTEEDLVKEIVASYI